MDASDDPARGGGGTAPAVADRRHRVRHAGQCLGSATSASATWRTRPGPPSRFGLSAMLNKHCVSPVGRARHRPTNGATRGYIWSMGARYAALAPSADAVRTLCSVPQRRASDRSRPRCPVPYASPARAAGWVTPPRRVGRADGCTGPEGWRDRVGRRPKRLALPVVRTTKRATDQHVGHRRGGTGWSSPVPSGEQPHTAAQPCAVCTNRAGG